jgi:hypothetical protein
MQRRVQFTLRGLRNQIDEAVLRKHHRVAFVVPQALSRKIERANGEGEQQDRHRQREKDGAARDGGRHLDRVRGGL